MSFLSLIVPLHATCNTPVPLVVTLCGYNEVCASQCSFSPLHAPGQRYLVLLVVITPSFKFYPPSDHGNIKLVHGYPDDFNSWLYGVGTVLSNPNLQAPVSLCARDEVFFL
jgi:hypothetical protein